MVKEKRQMISIVQKNLSLGCLLKRDIVKNRYLYLMALPVVIFYIIFHYKPMYGAIIAFKEFSPADGIWNSPWAGFKHFIDFFNGFYFTRVVKNTIYINILNLIWGFPAPIILALLLNEVRNKTFKRCVQTFTYLPHFISLVIICGLIKEFTASDGLINDIISGFGGTRYTMLINPKLFRTIYISSGIWQEAGWGSILYLAALSQIDIMQYEAATIDGASRWKQLWHVTIPGIMPTIIILLILRMGQMFNVGFEKIILLYNANTYETADVISSYVYRKGLLEFNWSFSTAVNLFNSVINFTMLILANWIARRVNENSLW